ncbi:MAG: prolyl oligopeptidase family serine peptidase [Planctomycetales bacterium]|nr:prolyl oligopeptidase family serine peptidase [Planctomycetales bacterium]
MKQLILISTALLCCLLSPLRTSADGPADNLPDQVRPVPPVGIDVPAADQQILVAQLTQLDRLLNQLNERDDAAIDQLIPDIEIFSRAVHQGLEYREFFSPRDVAGAKQLLAEGLQRAEALLQDGTAPWRQQTGLVVRGFRSRLDQTVQPYGLVVPESYSASGRDKFRLDLWFHGRGERTTETGFITERMTQRGPYTPDNTFVLHPFGRYSNAFKFAGEIDVFEALTHAQQEYRIDDDRIAVRGFSMGGAGCWQMAVHYPDRFFAANPGAGFSETPEFLKSFQQETLSPTWYERKLWRMYDCPGYAINLFQLPTIAYSGELDSQKQAADVMGQALAEHGMRLTHVIGSQTKHAIHAESARVIEEKMTNLALEGRASQPQEVRFATYTLKYDRAYWVRLTRLTEHWEQARVDARLVPHDNRVVVSTQNVEGLRLEFSAGTAPFNRTQPVTVDMSGGPAANLSQSLTALPPETDGSWSCELHRVDGQWQLGAPPLAGLRKYHGLQGPIDDALMDAFLVVRPTGTAAHDQLAIWSNAELERLVREWRRQFRGDARVKSDRDVTEQDIAAHHLLVFGDPSSNSVLASVMEELPLKWNRDHIRFADKDYDASHHAPIMIYPNPRNPDRYIVINSGFTYREYAYLNNARQVPKLPDWSIVDLRTAPNALWPGEVVDAGFFDESWNVK